MTDSEAVSLIRDLVCRYGIAFDTRDRAAFDDLWTEDGLLEVFQDGPDRPASGKLRPGQFQHAFDRLAVYRYTLHHVTTHVVDANTDGDSASGTVYCEAHHVDGSATGTDLVMHIRYLDQYRRDGARWYFTHRRVEVLATEERRIEPLV